MGPEGKRDGHKPSKPVASWTPRGSKPCHQGRQNSLYVPGPVQLILCIANTWQPYTVYVS